MTRINFFLTLDNEHIKVFRDGPIIGFLRAKSLKDILLRPKIPQIKNKGPRCEICKHIVPTRNVTSSTTKHTYQIRPENLNCRSKNVVYWYLAKLVEALRNNNYRYAHRNYCKNMKIKQESFQAHFADGVHSGEGDWEVRRINQSDSAEDLRKRKSTITWFKWFK